MRRETPPINHYRGCVQDISNKINTFAGVWSCWKRKAILDCILQTGNTLFLREKQEYRGSQRSEGIKTVLSTWNVSMHALADAMGFSMEFVRKSICIIWCVDGGVVTVWRGREWKVERRVKLQRVMSIRTPPGPLTQRLVWQTHRLWHREYPQSSAWWGLPPPPSLDRSAQCSSVCQSKSPAPSPCPGL